MIFKNGLLKSKFFILAIIVMGVFFLISLYVFTINYCPPTYYLNDTGVCMVMDTRDSRVLLELGDLDTNEFQLEIIDKRTKVRKKYKQPKFDRSLNEVKMSLTDQDNQILLNGLNIELEAIDPSK